MVRSHIASRCFFSAICGKNGLKFSGNLQVDLFFLLLLSPQLLFLLLLLFLIPAIDKEIKSKF
jgi:hypothetical protein